MKRLRIYLLLTLLQAAAQLSAQGSYENVIYTDDTKALVDSEITLSVKMRNTVDVEAFGFDLVLPYGMSVVTDDDGKPMVSLSEERTTARRTDTFGAAFRNTGSVQRCR